MSNTTIPAAAPAPVRFERTATGSGLSFSGLLRSEWIKLMSVRSTAWTYGMVILTSLGLTALVASSLASVMGSEQGGVVTPDSEQVVLLGTAATFGVVFGQMVVAVLGVLSISGEYSTGMIRSTLTAVPRRLPALGAKAFVLFFVTFLVGAISTIASFLLAAQILSIPNGVALLFTADAALQVLGGALYLGLIAVFSLGIGTIVRSSAGGISVVLGILFLAPIVLSLIPADWAQTVGPYLLSNVGTGIYQLIPAGQTPEFNNLESLLLVLAWVGASLAGAAALLKRRDA